MSKEYKENDADELSDIVELIDDEGNKINLMHIGTIEYKEKWYCFFQSPDECEDEDCDCENEVTVFELAGEEGNETLQPIEDDQLLDEVFSEFCRIWEEEEAAQEAMELEGVENDESSDKGCGCGCGHKHN